MNVLKSNIIIPQWMMNNRDKQGLILNAELVDVGDVSVVKVDIVYSPLVAIGGQSVVVVGGISYVTVVASVKFTSLPWINGLVLLNILQRV